MSTQNESSSPSPTPTPTPTPTVTPSPTPIPTPLSLADAVDNAVLSWLTGETANWFGEASTYYYNGSAAQSGIISDNQNSWLQTTVSGPGTFSFVWNVSSEDNFDFLEFYIDGIGHDRISGSVDWQQKSYQISSGTHRLKWRYVKDGSNSLGSDCGWLDQIDFRS